MATSTIQIVCVSSFRFVVCESKSKLYSILERAQIVIAIYKERWLKFAKSRTVNVYAKKDLVDRDAINACLDTTTIRTVNRVIVPYREVYQQFVTHPVNVLAWPVLLASNVHNVVPVTIRIPNVYVRFFCQNHDCL